MTPPDSGPPSGAGPGHTLRLTGLTRRFGAATAVDAVTLHVPPGQMLGVIGRSGAGKSTLLRMINRLVEPSAGSIHYGATDVTALRGRALRDWRTECAMIFQQFNLVPRLDVLTNVLIGRLNRRPVLDGLLGRFGAAERAMAVRALDRFGLAEVALRRAGTLSGGQQQRVAICRALVQEPRLLLADEPIASLDPHNARVVMDALRRIHAEDGLTVLVNLHHLDTAREYCGRIVGLRAGRVVFDGTPDDLTPDRVRAVYGADADERAQTERAEAERAEAERAEAERAEAERAGAERAGAERAGAERAGAERAGAERAGAERAGAERAADSGVPDGRAEGERAEPGAARA